MNQITTPDQTKSKEFRIQEDQYRFPYHHLVNFPDFDNGRVMMSGIEYYGYFGKVLELISKFDFNSILDFGCGDGKLFFELAKKFPDKKMTGIDLSERAIAFAKAFNYGNKAVFEAKDISFVSDSFDIVVSVETLEHIPDNEIPKVILSIDRILKSGGKFIVTVPAANIAVQSKHYRHYTLEMLKNYFKSYHLEEVYFRVKKGFVYRWFVYVSYKFHSFELVRKISQKIAENLLFQATDKTGRHIICVFKKP